MAPKAKLLDRERPLAATPAACGIGGLLLLVAAGTPVEGLGATPTLTGDWSGERSTLSTHGLDFDIRSGGTYQNVVGGGYKTDDSVLGASNFELRIDTARAAGWQGGELRVRGEARYGDDVQQEYGGFGAINIDSILPHAPDRVGRDVVALTELVFAQALTPDIQIYAGLVNGDTDDDNSVAGNLRSRDSFLNPALLTSVVRLRLSPQTALGAGLRFNPSANLSGDIRVFDSGEAAGESLLEFREGTTVAMEWAYKHVLFGHPGQQLIGLRYGFNRDYSLAGTEDPWLLADLAPGVVPGTRDDTWAEYYNISQSVADWGGGRGWGVFGRIGYGDNDANPIELNISVGAVATGLLATRPHDTAGWGYFHYYEVDGALMHQFSYDDEQGWEAWYNAEIMPWWHITADVQMSDTDIDRNHSQFMSPFVMPGGLGASTDGPSDLVGDRPRDITWVVGMRTEIVF